MASSESSNTSLEYRLLSPGLRPSCDSGECDVRHEHMLLNSDLQRMSMSQHQTHLLPSKPITVHVQ